MICYNRFRVKQTVFALQQTSPAWRENGLDSRLIAGALAGSLVSMTGSGAGFLLVPGLSLALSFSAFPSADLFKIAVATTHGANLITNLAAFQAHAVRRSIDWAAFIRLGPGSVAGAAAGALLATHLDTGILELVFIAFAVALPRGCYAGTGRAIRKMRRRLPCGSREAPRWACWPRSQAQAASCLFF